MRLRRPLGTRLLALALPLGVLGLGAALLVTPLLKRAENSFVLSRDKVEVARERMRVSRALYRGQDNAGRPFELSAAGAVQASSKVPVVAVNGVSAQVQLADGPARLTAPSGRYNMDTQQLTTDGALAFAAADGYRLDTGGVTADLRTQTLRSDTRVTGTLPLGRFEANAMVADLDRRSVTLTGGVRLHVDQRRAKAPR